MIKKDWKFFILHIHTFFILHVHNFFILDIHSLLTNTIFLTNSIPQSYHLQIYLTATTYVLSARKGDGGDNDHITHTNTNTNTNTNTVYSLQFTIYSLQFNTAVSTRKLRATSHVPVLHVGHLSGGTGRGFKSPRPPPPRYSPEQPVGPGRVVGGGQT